jgi:hypothetical protein
MTDAFGGCCVYDEGARHPCEPYGVLGWLLAGNDALVLSNCDDERLIALALDSLPSPLAGGAGLFLEGRVHRWVGTVSGLPGGHPVQRPTAATSPTRRPLGPVPRRGLPLRLDPERGCTTPPTSRPTWSSRDCGSRSTPARAPPRPPRRTGRAPAEGPLDADYHDYYDGQRAYEESFKEYFCEHYVADLIRAIWGWSPPYTLLDCGSASGLTLAAFDGIGVEAWGVENQEYIHARTPARWKRRNRLGDVRDLPFPDNSFDFVYDTCLCYLPEEDIDRAIRELYRVCRVGIYFGGIAADMTREVIEGTTCSRGSGPWGPCGSGRSSSSATGSASR